VTGTIVSGRPVVELLEREAVHRIRVRLGLPAGRELHRQLARRLPPAGTAGALEHLGEVAQERDPAERIVTRWTGAAHPGIVGR
jgi:hypothetical protein